MGKPNLVKDICTRLPLDLCFVIGLGQAFQKVIENNWFGLNKTDYCSVHESSS